MGFASLGGLEAAGGPLAVALSEVDVRHPT